MRSLQSVVWPVTVYSEGVLLSDISVSPVN